MAMSLIHEKRMPVAGFHPTSLIDYPGGKLASVIFTGGCNFHCGYCHNPELIKIPLYRPSIREILSKLAEKKDWIQNIVISGGEPLIHKDLIILIHTLVENGYKIKLDTNGSFPKRLDDLLKNSLLDYVAIDFKTSLNRYHEFSYSGVDKKILESMKVIAKYKNIGYEFRTTLCPIFISLEELKAMKNFIDGHTWVWQQFNPLKTLDPLFKHVEPYTSTVFEEFYKEIKMEFSGEIQIRGIEVF